jgi:RimJ/RimL family protein N-acetyltransferase
MGNDLTLRNWRESDCKTLYDWRNHPNTRKWCFQEKVFPFSDHQKWFNNFLSRNDKIGLILEASGVAAGQIRFETTEIARVLRVSISISPDFFGKGFGTSLLQLACKDSRIKALGDLVIAETMLDNLPSQRIFEKSHFIKSGEGSTAERSFLYWTKLLQPINVTCSLKGSDFAKKQISDFLCAHRIQIVSENADLAIEIAEANSSKKLAVKLCSPSLPELEKKITPFLITPYLAVANALALLLQEK